jgi:tetratricopeptide (TPR) repeat protein
VGIVVVLVCGAFAQTPQDAFNRGNDFYRAGKYQEAVKEYESIIRQGYVSAELYFNLGNAYYRMENLAQAILAYERAARLRPNDPDIQHNLRLLSMKTVDRIEPVPELFLLQWMRSVSSLASPETVRGVFVVSWIALFGSLAAMVFFVRRDALRALRIVLIASFVVVILSGAMLGLQALRSKAPEQAIITAQTITAKSSPDEKSVDAFVIHEGLKVRLTDSVADWVKITLADGKVGWIPAGDCEKI